MPELLTLVPFPLSKLRNTGSGQREIKIYVSTVHSSAYLGAKSSVFKHLEEIVKY